MTYVCTKTIVTSRSSSGINVTLYRIHPFVIQENPMFTLNITVYCDLKPPLFTSYVVKFVTAEHNEVLTRILRILLITPLRKHVFKPGHAEHHQTHIF